MDLKEMIEELNQASPSFEAMADRADFESVDGDEVYAELNAYAAHLVRKVQEGNEVELQRIFTAVEQILTKGDDEVYDRMVTEFLEDVQGIALGEDLNLDTFTPYLKPMTKTEWSKLITFWEDVE